MFNLFRPSKRPCAQTFMPMTPMPRRTASGRTVWMKDMRCTSAALRATRTVSKLKRRMPSSMMAGQAQEADTTLRAGLQECFESSALGEDPLEVVLGPQVVQLPEIEVIGPESAQAVVEQAQGTVAATLVSFGSKEDVPAALTKR